MVKHLLTGLLLCGSLAGAVKAQLPPKREFRAVWISTIANIDWPSRKGLTPDQQRGEFIQLLDFHQRNGINAIILRYGLRRMRSIPRPTSPGANTSPGSRGNRQFRITTRWSS